ncbi:AsmA family protein [Endozoicomonas ascidiicola]|uniref:AsmA family protein n=1 Tax=Endozoicomonas ascidiicola TaxID=1698521 RepID=UPI00082DE8CF|nr:AsmA family protein [Endozoicomonas ascidiicola]
MNRAIKFIAVLLAALVLLVVIAAALLPRFIDPNQFRGDITQTIYDQSGLKVNINGDIGWSIFPWVGLSLSDVAVEGKHNSKLAKLGSADVSVKVIPLLSKRIEMQTLELKGLELTLVKNKSGIGNWEVSAPVTTKQQPATTSEPADTTTDTKSTESSTSASAIKLNIASVNVSDLLISYDDQQAGQKYIIDNASLTTGAIRSQQPFDFHLKAHVEMPDLALNTSIMGNMTFNLEAGTYRLEKLNISASPDTAKAETVSIVGNLLYQQEPMLVQGNLGVNAFNAANLAKQIKLQLPPMADPKALTKVAFDSHFNTNGQSLNAEKLTFQLDDFSLNGNFKMSSIERGDMKFAFKGNHLNVDKYLPPATSSEPVASENSPNNNDRETTNQTQSSPPKEHPLIPEAMLRGLNLDGSLTLESLTVAKLLFEKPSVGIKAANGKQEVNIGSAFYQGTIDLTSTLDVRKAGNPKMAANGNLKGISLHALAKPLPDLKPVEGDVNTTMKLNTHGQYASTLTKNLNGDIAFQIDKGAFTEANFDKMVCETVAFVRKKELQTKDWGSITHFTDLSGTFVIANGVAKNKNLIAALANMNLKGDGYVNLVDRKMDYHIGLNIRGEESPGTDPACQINKDYVNVTWPVRCHGALDAPKCGVDTKRIGDVISSVASNKLQQKIEEKVQGPVKDLLKGLFK